MRRLFFGTLVSVAVLIFGVGTAAAVSVGDVVTITGGETTPIAGSQNGQPVSGVLGGLVQIDGVLQAYCVDTGHVAAVGQTKTAVAPTDLIGIGGINAANLPVLVAIISFEYPNTDPRFPLVGSPAIQSAAVQSALWHFSDGFELDQVNNPADMIANYNTILDRVANNAYPSLQGADNTMIESPADTEGVVGEVVGPFTVRTHASILTLAITGATRVDELGNPNPDTAMSNGEQFYLLSNTVGSATATVTGQNRIPNAVGLFPEGQGATAEQALLSVDVLAEEVSAQATASWVEEEVTPPVVGGVQVEAPQQPVAVKGAQVVGSLPVTGNDNGVLWVGVALVLAGALVLALREVMRNSVRTR